MATLFRADPAPPFVVPAPDDEAQRRLAAWNRERLAPAFPRADWALQLARDHHMLEGSGVEEIDGEIDLAITNPPFMLDPASPAYRDGGDMHGAFLSLGWALAAAARLAPGGRILLYTGSAIVAGEDRLAAALRERLPALGCTLRYAELDPDIFGEQLDEVGYEDVERIAAVGAVVTRAA